VLLVGPDAIVEKQILIQLELPEDLLTGAYLSSRGKNINPKNSFRSNKL
jgi:hypothetical protein